MHKLITKVHAPSDSSPLQGTEVTQHLLALLFHLAHIRLLLWASILAMWPSAAAALGHAAAALTCSEQTHTRRCGEGCWAGPFLLHSPPITIDYFFCSGTITLATDCPFSKKQAPFFKI